MEKLGIIVAVKSEAAAILRDSFYGWKKEENSLYYSAAYQSYLVLSGVGKVYAAYALSRIASKVDAVCTIGTSGGLGHERIGDLFLSTEFVEYDMDVTGYGYPPGVTPFSAMKQNCLLRQISPALEKRLKQVAGDLALELKEGRTISGDIFINNREFNDAKREQFSAHLVDMESAAVAKICATILKKDFFALRYVSDNADHESALTWEESVKKAAPLFNTYLKALLLSG